MISGVTQAPFPGYAEGQKGEGAQNGLKMWDNFATLSALPAKSRVLVSNDSVILRNF